MSNSLLTVRRTFSVIVLALAALWPSVRAWADDAARALAEVLPANTGLCLEVRDLAAHVQKFREGSLFDRFKSYPPLAKWAGKQQGDIQRLDGAIRAQLGYGIEELLTGVLGGEASLAIWPVDGKPGDVPMLLVVRAPDAKLLAKLQAYIVEAAKKGGQWQEELPLEIGGSRVSAQRVGVKLAGQSSYFLVHENLGLVTNREALLRQALVQHAGASGGESLATLPAYQAAMKRLSPAATVRLFLNPRPWDEQITANLAPAQDRDLLRRMIVRTWEASQYVAASLEIGRGLEAEAFLQCDTEALPEPLRNTVGSLSGTAQALDHLPGDALAAVAGRLDVRRVVRTLFVPGENGRSAVPAPETDFGWALATSIASGLGPNLGACLVPASAKEREAAGGWPLVWVAGLETQSLEADRDQPSLGKSLEPVLRTALAICAAANKSRNPDTTAAIESVMADDLTLTRIAGVKLFGAERDFVYAMVGNLLLAGGSADSVARTARVTTSESLGQTPRLKQLLSPRVGDPSQVLYADLGGLRRLLVANPKAAESLATAKSLDPETAQRSWHELLANLNLADAMLVEMKIDSTGISLSARATVDEGM